MTKDLVPSGVIVEHARIGLGREQRNAIPPFAMLRAFEAVGSCGGIRRAAAMLSVDHAAVSRHLRALEDWTGITLVDRTSGASGKLTDQGRLYHQRISGALAEIAVATLDLTHCPNDLLLRLWCAPGLASDWLSGRIGAFTHQHPELDIELQPSELSPDFDANQADAYIHYVIDTQRQDLRSSLRTVEIARPPILALASPGFVATAPHLETPADLTRSTLLHEASADQWRRWFAQHGIDDTGQLGGPKFWQNHLTIAAARQGQGIALANALLARDDLASGRLVAIGDWAPVFMGTYHFTARRDSWRAITIASFRRWLEQMVAECGAPW